MAPLNAVNRHRFRKSLEREALDERGLDFRRCDGKPSSGGEVDFIGWSYRLDAGGERKSITDKVAILNGDIAERDHDAYGQAIVAAAQLRQSQSLLHRDRCFGRAGDT